MLTGRPAFDGEDVPDILSRILQREPDWSLLPSNTPPRIHELLRLCLEKNSKNRRSHATDVRIDIEQALLHRPVESHDAQATQTSRRHFWIGIAAVLFIAVAALSLPAFRYFRQDQPPEMRLEISTPSTSNPLAFALSPSGRHLVFLAAGDGTQRLWLRELASTNAQPLAGTESASYPLWSPDGRSIAFFAGGQLKRLDIGGSPQTLAEITNSAGATWNSDGTILFGQRAVGTPLYRISAAGGQQVAVTHVSDGQTGHREPQFLPDGQHFLFFVNGNQDQQGVYFGSLNGESRRLIAADTAGLYLPPGFLLFIRQRALIALRFDATNGEVSGDPITIATGTSGGFSVSATGLVAYRTGNGGRGQLTWYDRLGKTLGVVGGPDDSGAGFLALSPDNRRVVTGGRDIWLLETARNIRTRLTFNPEPEDFPVWSPDGKWIAFRAARDGKFTLYQKLSSGVGDEQLLLESETIVAAQDWSPDGRFLLYYRQDPKTGFDLEALPITGERRPIPVVNRPFEERGGQFSPDGTWIAYHSNENGRFEVYVQPFPEPSGKWQVSTNGGVTPRWSRDGKELFYVGLDGKLMAVPVRAAGSVFEPDTPVVLFQTQIVELGNPVPSAHYAVSTDGRFLISVSAEEAASPITVIVNWSPPEK
jgi:Tol biopolymer transport system component